MSEATAQNPVNREENHMVMTRWGDGMGEPPPMPQTDEPTPEQKARYKELRASGKNPMEARRIVLSEAKNPSGKRR